MKTANTKTKKIEKEKLVAETLNTLTLNGAIDPKKIAPIINVPPLEYPN